MAECQDGRLAEGNVAQVVSGETVEEDRAFEWRVHNILSIKSSKILINAQKFSFDVGTSIGMTTNWVCYLQGKDKEVEDTKGIGIYLHKVNGPEEVRTVVHFTYQLIKPSGPGDIITGELSPFKVGDRIGVREVVPVEDNAVEEIKWEDGSILIKMDFKFTIFKPAVVIKKVDVEEERKILEREEMGKVSEAMRRMIRGKGGADGGRMIRVVSRDGKEFNAHSVILVERSAVFRGMFGGGGRWEEGKMLVLGRLRGKSVEVFLNFVVGGVLGGKEEEWWKEEEVLEELMWAAGKYQVEGLIRFLDKVIPEMEVEKGEVLRRMLTLSRSLEMKNAEEGLVKKLNK